MPVLYDREADTIVYEGSADVARMLAAECGRHATTDRDALSRQCANLSVSRTKHLYISLWMP